MHYTRRTFDATKYIDIIMLLIILTNTILCILWRLSVSAYGFDITDEAYYLLSTQSPFLYKATTSNFSFVYHPIYKLLNGDIVLLRQFNLILTVVLSYYLFLTFFNVVAQNTIHVIKNHVISLSLSTAALLLGQVYIYITPNYNSLNLQAFIVIGTGVLLTIPANNKNKAYPPLLIGIGWWLVFMAKPTSAIIMALLLLCYMWILKKIHLRFLIITSCTVLALFVASALVIDGSILAFINRLRIGVEFGQILAEKSYSIINMFRIEDFGLSSNIRKAMRLIPVLTTVWVLLLISKKTVLQSFGILLSFIPILIIYSIIFGMLSNAILLTYTKGLIISSITVSCMLTSVFVYKSNILSHFDRTKICTTILFLLMPYAFYFGSNVPMWMLMSQAGIFWVLSGLYFLVPSSGVKFNTRILYPFALLTPTIVVFILFAEMNNPYRQNQPFSKNNSSIKISTSSSPLILSANFKNFLENIVSSSRNAGFTPKTPIIDLTGRSPGVLYAMQGKALGGAGWLLGEYPGSNKFAEISLSLHSCEDLAQAWLLVSTNERVNISSSVINIFGASLQNDYTMVATWNVPKGIGGNEQDMHQMLMKPTRDLTIAYEQCITVQDKKFK